VKRCRHLKLKVLYLEHEDGSVQLEICKNDRCAHITTLCEHKYDEWVYTRNEEDPEEKKLICKLCGADGT
jgi:hypothetical protein